MRHLEDAIPEDLWLYCFLWCEASDVAQLQATSRQVYSAELFDAAFKAFCIQNWNISPSEVLNDTKDLVNIYLFNIFFKIFLEYPKKYTTSPLTIHLNTATHLRTKARHLPENDGLYSYRELYQYCWPLCAHLVSSDSRLQTTNNEVSFHGAVGEGNRSVQAVMSLPLFQRGEKYDKNWLLNICNFFFNKNKERFQAQTQTEADASPAAEATGTSASASASASSSSSSSSSHGRKRASSFTDVTGMASGAVPLRVGVCNKFSMPFWDHRTRQLNITPRLVAYFEVDIQAGMGVGINRVSSTSHMSSHSRSSWNFSSVAIDETEQGDSDDDQDEEEEEEEDNMSGADEDKPVPDCIAIGIASNKFLLKHRLPGWDAHSYGYHSDDGAIFHGRGRQLSSYGPTFGVGDVVGCGIDYVHGSVFFTLNGRFLGTAFSKLQEQAFHPTIGVDACVTVTVNFGREPFQFDLATYMAPRAEDNLMDCSPPCIV